jgi:hypothetical protein
VEVAGVDALVADSTGGRPAAEDRGPDARPLVKMGLFVTEGMRAWWDARARAGEIVSASAEVRRLAAEDMRARGIDPETGEPTTGIGA